MAKFFFLLRLVFIKPQKIFYLPSGCDILALSIIFIPMKSYNCPIDYPVFYQLIRRLSFFYLVGDKWEETN